MDTSVVKSAPKCDFVEISALMKDWDIKFLTTVGQKRAIKYDMYPMPDIPDFLQNALRFHGYQALILENDRWQHFFVPKSG